MQDSPTTGASRPSVPKARDPRRSAIVKNRSLMVARRGARPDSRGRYDTGGDRSRAGIGRCHPGEGGQIV